MTSARCMVASSDLAAPLLDEAGVHEADVAADDGGDVDAGSSQEPSNTGTVGVGGGEEHIDALDGLPGACPPDDLATAPAVASPRGRRRGSRGCGRRTSPA